jgi:uncharacterized protein
MPMVDSGAALFAGSASEFVRMAPESSLTAHLEREFKRRFGTPNDAEVRSWQQSLTALASVVGGVDLDRSGVGVELRLPMSSKRLDVALVARDHEARPKVLLVELKQWESASPSRWPDNVVVAKQEKLHPSVQVTGYAEYLRESHSAFTEDDFAIHGCAYLHNMPAETGHAIRGVQYGGALKDAPMFTKDEEGPFGDFLLDSLAGGDGVELLSTLVKGRYRPSIALLDGIARSLRDSPVWTLVDEQRLAFNIVRGLVERAAATGEKAVVVVTGGPGTGKSVIAAHLVIALARNGNYRAAHCTASKAFTTNLRALGGRAAAAIFRWNMDFAHRKTEPNAVDVLVIDEAHRVRETSNMRYTPRHHRSDIPQANELIRAARVAVFLLDEHQNVRPDEIGTVAAIRTAAEEEGVPVEEIRLDTQFRCNGCAGYIRWVERLFSDTPDAPGRWLAAGEYDLRVFDAPASMEYALEEQKARGHTERIVAGFCWPWSDPVDGWLVSDVQIDDWNRPWNEKSREQWRKAGAAPRPELHPYYLWATDSTRTREIGCIYSAQGFEFDYCGVILGNDLVWRDGVGWVASKDASYDPGIARRKWQPSELRRILGHVYRVLLTRGMRGTYVYSTDFETRRFLSRLIER